MEENIPIPGRNRIFISYAHDDDPRHLTDIRQHLGGLALQGRIELWDDTRIGAGQLWEAAIEKQLSECRLAVLLISPAFLASRFIRSKEVPRLIARHEQEGLQLMLVLIRHCLWEAEAWLAARQMRPGGAPLAESGAERDRQLVRIVKEIARFCSPAPPGLWMPSSNTIGSSAESSPSLSDHAHYTVTCLRNEHARPFMVRLEARVQRLQAGLALSEPAALVHWICGLQDSEAIRDVLDRIKITATDEAMRRYISAANLKSVQQAVLSVFWLAASCAVKKNLPASACAATSKYLLYIPEPANDAIDASADGSARSPSNYEMACQVVAGIVALATQGRPLNTCDPDHLHVPRLKEVHWIKVPVNGDHTLQSMERAAYMEAVGPWGRAENKRTSTTDSLDSRPLNSYERSDLEGHIRERRAEETIAFVTKVSREVASSFADTWRVATILPTGTAGAGEVLHLNVQTLFSHVSRFWADWRSVVDGVKGENAMGREQQRNETAGHDGNGVGIQVLP